MTKADDDIETLQKSYKSMEEAFTDAVSYFGEDLPTTTTEDFFGTFAKFCDVIQDAAKQNEVANANVEKAKRREDAKNKRVIFFFVEKLNKKNNSKLILTRKNKLHHKHQELILL